MARYSQFDFYQQSPSTLDVPPSEEDEMSVLDDKILEPSPDLDHRRSSYDTQDALSHRDSVWSNYSHSGSNQSRPTSHLGHTMLDSSGAFIAVDGPHSTAYAQSSWPLSRTESGSCTPTAGYEQYPAEGDSSSAPFAGGAVGPVSSMPMNPMSYRGGMAFAPPGGVAMSPQSSQGWMPAPMDLADAAAQSTKSPTYRNGSPLTVRRDGIRKKNARFEIPAERTLSNIDHLINQSTNEEEIKELKQQKRLLRNRQAALDSRQRKKLHTEKLEEEKKHFTQTIGDLEDALQNMKIREAELMREKSEWIAAQQQINQYLEGLHMEKDEMIRVHTLETAELRKKNNILIETVEKLERGAKPVVPDNLAGDFSGFENLGMDGNPWDDFAMPNGLPLHSESLPASSTAVHPQPLRQANGNSEKPNPAVASDCPFSWNAFYMCLLFGAFIASNSTSLPGRSLPQMSEEYRAESANVLKAVLASSPPEMAQPSNNAAVSASATGSAQPTTITGMEMAQMSSEPTESSVLDELHNSLVMPTEDQQREQVFSLNAEQYNSLTTFDDHGAGLKPQQPSNLQQALAAMRNTAAQHRMQAASTSDVYTRSLMWDRVPQKVIRDFRRMVQEYGASPMKDATAGFQAV